jgi:hypothetical protein
MVDASPNTGASRKSGALPMHFVLKNDGSVVVRSVD